MSKRISIGVAALLTLAAGCSTTEVDDRHGGIAVEVVFAGADGVLQRGLRAASVPTNVARLQILAVDADDETLAETNLYADPAEGQTALVLAGGVWQLNDVPVGVGRAVVSRAYLGASADPARNLALAFEGRLDGVEVRASRVTTVGPLVLAPVGLRIPELDFEGPDAPRTVRATAVPEGRAIEVTFEAPPQPDLAGYIVAVGTSSAVLDTPGLARGRTYAVGEALAPSVHVIAAGPFDGDQRIRIDGLTDGVTYSVLVYAHDADLAGAALNYSQSAAAFAVPADTLGPPPVLDLTITATTSHTTTIQFRAPEERPVRYDVRASLDALLLDELSFGDQRFVRPPAPGGLIARFARTFIELGATSTTTFFVGVRGYDAAGNAGAIAIAEHVGDGDGVPTIAGFNPPIGVAERDLTIRGTNLGQQLGEVVLTTTGTSADTINLEPSRWTDTEIVLTLPSTARTGMITVRRADLARTQAFLPVVLRHRDPLIRRCFPYTCSADLGRHPFEMVGAGASDGSTTVAIYRECCTDGFTGGVERIFGLEHELLELAPRASTLRGTWVAGTYAPDRETLSFVASGAGNDMSTVQVSADANADPSRLDISVAAGAADRVALVPMDAVTGDPRPAMIAFTLDGVIRTSTVGDLRREVFNAFYATRSDELTYESVTLARRADGVIMMAHRSTDASGRVFAELRRNQTRDPSGFTSVGAAQRPAMANSLELLTLPSGSGGDGRFILIYESVEPDGSVDVRILPTDAFGARPGYAPLRPQPGTNRRLEDAGMIMRDGVPWLVLVITEPRPNDNVALIYTEVPMGAVDDAAASDGGWPGAVLDVARQPAKARVACKPLPQNTCPIGWLGPTTNRLFIRR